LEIFIKSVEKIQVLLKFYKIEGTLREELCKFMTLSRWILLRMGNVSGTIFRQNQNTNFMFNELFFFENLCLF